MKIASCLGAAAVIAAVIAAASPVRAQQFEGPAEFKAADVVPPSLLKGPHYTVADAVKTDGYLHEFVVQSDFGSFAGVGTGMLYVRLGEVRALAALQEVSKSDVFLNAAGNSVLSVGKSVGQAVNDTKGTVEGLGAGAKRFGENLGRKAKKGADTAMEAVKDDESKPDAAEDKSSTEKAVDAGASAAKSYLGVSAAARRWAQKLVVDPYTSNPVLRTSLEEIGKIDAAGGIAAKAVVPIPPVIGTAADVSQLVWGKDPEELAKLNEQRLAELGVDKAVAAAFLKSKAFSPSRQTRFVAGLHAVRAAGIADYVDTAREAAGEIEAEFFTQSAEMLAAFHAGNPVQAVLADSRALVAVAGKQAAALLPLDSVRWTEPTAKALAEMADRARKELSADSLRIELTGRMSARALKEAGALGWSVAQGVPGPIPPPGPARP